MFKLVIYVLVGEDLLDGDSAVSGNTDGTQIRGTKSARMLQYNIRDWEGVGCPRSTSTKES